MTVVGVTDMGWSATLPGNRIERTRHRGDGNRVLDTSVEGALMGMLARSLRRSR